MCKQGFHSVNFSEESKLFFSQTGKTFSSELLYKKKIPPDGEIRNLSRSKLTFNNNMQWWKTYTVSEFGQNADCRP